MIRIINPGIYTSIQDLGRYGYQQYGMPVAGAMDSFSLRVANKLVGNAQDLACLEACFTGPEFEVLSPSVMGMAGGKAPVWINNHEVDLYSNQHLQKGDVVKIGSVEEGCRLYIAFAGGIDVNPVMGSRSTYSRAQLGGFNGRQLMCGDEMLLGKPVKKVKKRKLRRDSLLSLEQEQTLRVIGGSDIQRFDIDGVKTFLTSTYTILGQSDRMGYRLEGPSVKHLAGADILSSGIGNGAIQVPGDGQPIIMLADRQTVGGYAKIANVISADLPLLGQMKAGNKLTFQQVHLDEAHQLLKEQEKKLRSVIL